MRTTTSTATRRPRQGRGATRTAALRGLAIGLGLVAAVAIAQTTGVRRAIMHDAPEQAPAWSRGHALSLQAVHLFDDGQFDAAESAARRALQVTAGNAEAIRILGQAADRRGDGARAMGLMGVGARWSWRDIPTQWWLFERLMAQGDLPDAMLHGEALAGQNQGRSQLWPYFANAAADPRGRGPLLDALERGPGWRGAFYQHLRNLPPELQPALAQVMQELARRSASPRPEEAAPLMEAMLASGRVAEARHLWAALFLKGRPMPLINDGGFDRTTIEGATSRRAGLFDWRVDPGAEVYLVPASDDDDGQALHVANAGEARGPLAQQRLLLDPGVWVLSFRLRVDRPESLPGVQVGVRCANRGPWLTEPLASFPGDGGWHRYELPFTSDGQCPNPLLSIEPTSRRARQPIDVWIDDFAISPASRTAPGPTDGSGPIARGAAMSGRGSAQAAPTAAR